MSGLPKKMRSTRKREILYIKDGIRAKGHTPIYKFHKYFARRPHNVFEYLIESYTREGDLVLDCFCGGGVTVVEGVRASRRVVGVDANPLAVFVTESQLTLVQRSEYEKHIGDIQIEFAELVADWYTTECRKCGDSAEVRWYENAYVVQCPECGEPAVLDNGSKSTKNGKAVNGQYDCQHCLKPFKAVDAPRVGDKLISLRFRCKGCAEHADAIPTDRDVRKKVEIEKQFDYVVDEMHLSIPNDDIPDYWDRQLEDCLHRKGFRKFRDFFTIRNLLAVAILKRLVQAKKPHVSASVYRMLLFTFSATVRYLNNLNFSTKSWMGGRPVAWAKHAFWTPNQFVEVNPVEYVDKRRKAFLTSLKYQNHNFAKLSQAPSACELIEEPDKYTHAVICGSSNQIDLPDCSVDAVITDPPYGSNVQYGELSSFWLVWLKDELDYIDDPTDIDREVLTHRKTRAEGYAKSVEDYYSGLYEIFAECHRVLKDHGPLTFTFNNKNLHAWFAVIKAVIDAGFILEPGGVVYQEPIHIYRDTAHSRADGALQGDFIYTFVKGVREKQRKGSDTRPSARSLILSAALELIEEHGRATKREMHVACLTRLIPLLVDLVHDGHDFESVVEIIEVDFLESALQSSNEFKLSGKHWVRRSDANA
jgi:adenine-specific DNA methylase